MRETVPTTHFLILVGGLLTATVAAQRGPAPDPLVNENATVKLAAAHLRDPGQQRSVGPEHGIVVGARATLVIDPGLAERFACGGACRLRCSALGSLREAKEIGDPSSR